MDKEKAAANEALSKLSEKYDRRSSQIMLRWAIQRGCAVIPGTGNPGESHSIIMLLNHVAFSSNCVNMLL